MRSTSGTKTALAVASALSVVLLAAGCDDDADSGDDTTGAGEEATPSVEVDALPTGPVPELEPWEGPDLEGGTVVRVKNKVWLFGELVNTSENLTVSTLVEWGVAMSPDGERLHFDDVSEVWEREYLVEPGRTLPVVWGVSGDELDEPLPDSDDWVFGNATGTGASPLENVEWAHPWPVEPVESSQLKRQRKKVNGNPSYRASFQGTTAARGQVLCYDTNGHVRGGHPGDVTSQDGAFFVEVVMSRFTSPGMVDKCVFYADGDAASD